MKKKNDNLKDAAKLRQKAEELLKHRDKAYLVSKAIETDLLKLTHELEIHQIELEMQNEELDIAKEKSELAEKKYNELYNFAQSAVFPIKKRRIY